MRSETMKRRAVAVDGAAIPVARNDPSCRATNSYYTCTSAHTSFTAGLRLLCPLDNTTPAGLRSSSCYKTWQPRHEAWVLITSPRC